MNSINDKTRQDKTRQDKTRQDNDCSLRLSCQYSQCNFLGSLYGRGTSFAGAVWDKNYISPTINTCQGGGREPHIVIRVQ